jgi:hypothetical protein
MTAHELPPDEPFERIEIEARFDPPIPRLIIRSSEGTVITPAWTTEDQGRWAVEPGTKLPRKDPSEGSEGWDR